MFDIHRVELDWGGRKLTLETGKVARQADGAVIATYGETTVIATAVAAKQPKPGIDFLPLTVIYTDRSTRRRIISARKARRKEREAWQSYVALLQKSGARSPGSTGPR